MDDKVASTIPSENNDQNRAQNSASDDMDDLDDIIRHTDTDCKAELKKGNTVQIIESSLDY